MIMAPIREYSNWDKRSISEEEQIEPFRCYYLICEGSNTERWYFEEFINLKKELGINGSINVVYLEKTGEDETKSYAKDLVSLAETHKSCVDSTFDANRDKMIIVFDADIYENRESDLKDILTYKSDCDIFGITNPSFELFLLLHYANSYEESIRPHEADIIKNEKVGQKRYISKLFTDKSGMNSKTNKDIVKLAKDVQIAIAQEENINTDINQTNGKLTSNIGQILKMIIQDRGAE